MTYMVMRALTLCAVLCAIHHASAEPEVRWDCAVHVDPRTQFASGAISLRVDSRRFLLTDRPLAACYVLPKSHYQMYEVPSNAITACIDGFGPSSEEFYVVRRARTLLVFHRIRNDSDTATPRYRIIKRISLPP
jgi:hypothetical protein